MPHRDFDAARRAYAANHQGRDPITFTLGGEVFNVPFEPTLGDTFDLADAPEVTFDEFDSTNQAHLKALRVLKDFMRRAVPEEERARFDRGLYRIPVSEQAVILEVAQWITEQWTTFPTTPPVSSWPGRDASGTNSKSSEDGAPL